MKKNLSLILSATALLLASATLSWAADKKVTLTGEGKCGKCALKETAECQNVIVHEEAGKKTTYYFAKNDKSDKFHKELCQGVKKVKAVGTVKEEKGKMMLTIEEIELVK